MSPTAYMIYQTL